MKPKLRTSSKDLHSEVDLLSLKSRSLSRVTIQDHFYYLSFAIRMRVFSLLSTLNPLGVISSDFLRYDLIPSISLISTTSVISYLFLVVKVKRKFVVSTTHRSLHYLRNFDLFLRVPSRMRFFWISVYIDFGSIK